MLRQALKLRYWVAAGVFSGSVAASNVSESYVLHRIANYVNQKKSTIKYRQYCAILGILQISSFSDMRNGRKVYQNFLYRNGSKWMRNG